MNKELAMTLLNSEVVSGVAKAHQAGNLPESEVARFESMLRAVADKGQTLPESFFSAIPDNTNGRDIFRAVHAA